MTPFERPGRCCPKCYHSGYMFRGRKTIEAAAEQGGKQVETRYRCRSCGHEWTERIPAPPEAEKRSDAA